MHDMHCHLNFINNAEDVAEQARQADCLLFANTVTPDEWRQASSRFARFGNVTVGFGLHPWWIEAGCNTLSQLEHENPRFIGEVGLDFGRRHAETGDKQVEAFTQIAKWAARKGGKTLSLHSVHAAKDVIDILESAGAFESCSCIFHWFTGPSDQLKRAIDAGCFFSVGPRMAATGKGREYLKAIPEKQLLLETDAPPAQGQEYSFEELKCELRTIACAVSAAKGEGALSRIDENSRALLAQQ